MERLYLDAAPVIYTVEQVAPFASWVDARLATLGVVRVASELTRLECRIKPLRTSDAALLQDFEDFFSGTVAEMVPFSRAVWDRAAEIRAQYGLPHSGRAPPRCGFGGCLRRLPYQRPPS